MKKELKLTLEKKQKISIKNEKKGNPLKLTSEPKNYIKLKTEEK